MFMNRLPHFWTTTLSTALLCRKFHALARLSLISYPSTAISSAVNPYNSYTNASAFGVTLEHGLDVRCLLLGRQKVTGTFAVPVTWKADRATRVTSFYLIHQNRALPS
jgi:hypothetical protein